MSNTRHLASLAVAERTTRLWSHGSESSADPARPIDGDAVGADQLQQLERRPTHA